MAQPVTHRWCVLEVKLGAGSADADLAQLCLYHEMLREVSKGTPGEISLLHFQPDLKSDQFSEEQIELVKPKLRALIGRLAGLVTDERTGVHDDGVPKPAHRELGARLVQVLGQFGPMVALDSDPIVGPSFLRFHIMPAPGVKVKQILPLGQDLAVQLRLSNPAFIKYDRGALAIDLQRPDRQTLLFSECRHMLPAGAPGNAKLLVGIDLRRQAHFADLRECPHILVAGTAGSGKSEWLLTALASLIATNPPDTLRVMLIDPKRVTFKDMTGSPFLLDGRAMLYTPDEALAGLERLIELMEDRYALMTRHGCKDLASLMEKVPDEAPPRIAVFCDEYGNLVAARKMRENIESAVVQLGAKARAAGIHLILATQDPRAQILTPALKSNLDGRVCLRTTSSIQSRMMLEENGAESLLGKGDLLFKTVGDPLRLQAPLLEESDRQLLFGPRVQAA
jgi:DNA segregation ATPase FtsK/SpoIIIE-like protein